MRAFAIQIVNQFCIRDIDEPLRTKDDDGGSEKPTEEIIQVKNSSVLYSGSDRSDSTKRRRVEDSDVDMAECDDGTHEDGDKNGNRSSPTSVLNSVSDVSDVADATDEAVDFMYPTLSSTKNAMSSVPMRVPRIHPTRSPAAIRVRATICAIVQLLQIDMVHNGYLRPTDIVDKKQHGFLLTLWEDLYGAMAASNAILRYLLRNETAAFEFSKYGIKGLSLRARLYIGAAIFLAHKAKSEDVYAKKAEIAKVIYSQLLSAAEATLHTNFEKLLCIYELNILRKVQVHTLLEFNTHANVEAHIRDVVKRGVLSMDVGLACLSYVGVVLNRITTLESRDWLSEFESSYKPHIVANGFFAAALVSVRESGVLDNYVPHPDAFFFSGDALDIASFLLTFFKRYGWGIVELKPTAVQVQEVFKSSTQARALKRVTSAKRLLLTLPSNVAELGVAIK